MQQGQELPHNPVLQGFIQSILPRANRGARSQHRAEVCTLLHQQGFNDGNTRNDKPGHNTHLLRWFKLSLWGAPPDYQAFRTHPEPAHPRSSRRASKESRRSGFEVTQLGRVSVQPLVLPREANTFVMISPVEFKDKVVALHWFQDKRRGLSLFHMPSSHRELPGEPKAAAATPKQSAQHYKPRTDTAWLWWCFLSLTHHQPSEGGTLSLQ